MVQDVGPSWMLVVLLELAITFNMGSKNKAKSLLS